MTPTGGRCHHLRHPYTLRQRRGRTQSVHRFPRRLMVPRQAERKSRQRVRIYSHAARRQRKHHHLAIQSDGPPRANHCSYWLRGSRRIQSRNSLWRVARSRTSSQSSNRGRTSSSAISRQTSRAGRRRLEEELAKSKYRRGGADAHYSGNSARTAFTAAPIIAISSLEGTTSNT